MKCELPANFAYELADPDTPKPIAEWRALGVKTAAGDALADAPDNAGILLPAGAHGPAFLVLPNFSMILKYNNAASYALAVALLADRMAGAAPLQSCLAARRTAAVAQPNASSSRPIWQSWALIPARRMACWAARAAPRCANIRKPRPAGRRLSHRLAAGDAGQGRGRR